ncbi:MAG TPA: ATP-binding cassette domain-containing protein [Acidimicrobiales bacterium]
MTPSLLGVSGLGIRMGGHTLLDDISFELSAGQALALSGPSGSGKSVLLHALAGVLPWATGSLALDGDAVVSHDPAYRARIGLILQSHGLASGLTAEENLALPLQARGLPRAEIVTRCAQALADVDLEGAAGQLVEDLSGGQRQRVGVARALALQPAIVLADEPTAELDPANRARILTLLVAPPTPRLVVIASNDPQVLDVCAEVLHLREGRLVSA